MWLEEADLPDVEAVLEGRVKWKPDRRRPDITEAVLTGCTDYILQTAEEEGSHAVVSRWGERFWKILNSVKEHDLTFRSAKRLTKPGYDITKCGSKDAKEVIRRLADFTRNARL